MSTRAKVPWQGRNTSWGTPSFPRIAGLRLPKHAGHPWGRAHVSSGCIYNGNSPSRRGFTELDPPNFTFRATSTCLPFYSGTKEALGEEVLEGYPNVFRSAPSDSLRERGCNPRNYLTKLMRYPRLLEATNSVSEMNEFVAATLERLEPARCRSGTYNVTNEGTW